MVIASVLTIFVVSVSVPVIIFLSNRKSVSVRILVNGTRGKSTVAGMIAHVLRSEGRRVLLQTDRALVLPDGTSKPVTSVSGVYAAARRCKADAVVYESLGHSPWSFAFEGHLVRPTIAAITNAFPDFLASTAEDTAKILALSVPKGCAFYTSDLEFLGDPQGILVAKGKTDCERNQALACRLVSELGISLESAQSDLASFISESCPQGPFMVDGHRIFNCPGPISAKAVKGEDVTLVYSNRAGREARLALLINLILQKDCRMVVVMGDNVPSCVRHLQRNLTGRLVVPADGDPSDILKTCFRDVVVLGDQTEESRAFVSFCCNSSLTG